MFKPARWWSEKNKLKVDFKLQFHASQVAQVGGDGLMIAVVHAESGKPTVKSDKATVQDGSCFWENPVYETVKFNQDPKSGKIHEKIYYFVVGTGPSKSGVVGEASIDFSNYAEVTKVSLVSLPLKNSKTEAILHVSIQRIQESMDEREIEESENTKLHSVDHALSSQLDNHDKDGTIRTDSIDDMPFNKTFSPAELNVKHRASSGSDVTLSSSESSSGIEEPWELQMSNDNIHQEPKSGAPTPIYEDHRRSWDWLGNSALEASTDDSLNTPTKETFLRQDSEEAPDIVIEKLKSDVVALSRQAEISDLELQTLRKQIVKESKRGHDFWREIVSMKEERDALKGECEHLKALQRRKTNGASAKTNLVLDGLDSQAVIEELKQELNHTKEMNANLQIQLQKTQESNSELILAVRDLDEMLEQKNRSFARDVDEKYRDDDNSEDDDEQKALEDLVKEHSDPGEAYLLDQQIVDLRSEIEIYKRDKDELEIQMEQLALDFEIMKQANHKLSNKLEQSQIQEQLKMQYECSSSDTPADELETHIENLEKELKRQSEEYTDSLATISELEAHAKSLEEELEKRAQGFEADLEVLTQAKVEQEQRAIRAEETLKKIRWKNANTAERLQEEFRRLSMQMASTFQANEKLATKAMAEANELRLTKSGLEEMLRRATEEQESVKGHYETRLHKLSGQVRLMTSQIEKMQLEIEENTAQLENQKKHDEDAQRILSDEILKLRDEIETHISKNKILLKDLESKKTLMHDLEQMGTSVKEKELLVEQGNDERIELENRVILVNNEAKESHKELNKMRCLLKEKELIVANMQSELESIQAQCTESKDSRLEDDVEKENLRKLVLQLRSDLKKRDETFNSMEKKLKDGSGRRTTTLDVVKVTSKNTKSSPRASKEVTILKERIKLLESQIKSKQTDLETSAIAFLDKEKDLRNKIQELEGGLEVYQSRAQLCENEVEKPAAAGAEDQATICRLSEVEGNGDKNASTTSMISNKKRDDLSETQIDSTKNAAYVEELNDEMELLKEKNKSMEEDLQEMQGRYLDISLKFAEVEGERQQLIMKLRNLTNANKST